jgi:AcrR family transcriptional regulator
MAESKVIPIGQVQSTRERLIDALAEVLIKRGFSNLSVDDVAETAGVNRRVLHRYFGGLPDLLAAFGMSERFWPTAREIMGGDPESMKRLSPACQVSRFFKGFLAGILTRPKSLDILAWELLERNRHSKILEHVRVRTALEYFELLHGDVPEEIDLSAIVALLGGGVMFLAVRSRQGGYFGGLNMWDEEDRERIDAALDLLLESVFNPDPPSASNPPGPNGRNGKT